MCIYVWQEWEYVYMSVGIHTSQKKVTDSLELAYIPHSQFCYSNEPTPSTKFFCIVTLLIMVM